MPKQGYRQNGLLAPGFMAQENRKQDEAAGESAPGPGLLQQLRKAVHDEDHGQPITKGAQAIAALGPFDKPFFFQEFQDSQAAEDTADDDEEENAAPAEIVVEKTAQYRPQGEAYVDHRDVPAHSHAPLFQREDEDQDGHVGRVNHGRRQSLQQARSQKPGHGRSKKGTDGRQGKEHGAPEKDLAFPYAVGHFADRQEEDHRGQEENLQDPAQGTGTGAEFPAHVGQGQGEGTARKRRQERREHDNSQYFIGQRPGHKKDLSLK